MLAYTAPRSMSLMEALGDGVVDQFFELSDLHRDGWGHASISPGTVVSRATGMTPAREGLRSAGAGASRIAISYLRFASAGTAVSTVNLQPFEREGIAFAHNGALVPRDRITDALTGAERAALHGTTDSEMYFALLRRYVGTGVVPLETVYAAAVARVRELYPAACLNAMLIVGDALVVIHSPGTVAPPLEAFAARGFEAEDLPRGHDHGYNILSTAVLPNGARVVTTAGVEISGLQELERDTVFVFTIDSETRRAAITTGSARRPRSNVQRWTE